MKKQRNQYDERQLAARGVAFRWTTVTFFAELVIWEFLCSLEVIDAEPLAELCLLITPPFIVGMILLILSDAYDPIDNRPGVIIFALMPLTGIIMILDKIRDGDILFLDRCILDDGGILAIYVGWIVCAAVYWISYARERNAEKAPDAED